MDPVLDERLKRVFKMSSTEVEQLTVAETARYYDVLNKCIESEDTFKKRVIFWDWMVSCLKRGQEKGPFSYLCDDINMHQYDVAGLVRAIVAAVDIQNPFLFWSAFTDFVNAKPEGNEDIFSYFTRIHKMARSLAVREPTEVGIADVGMISEFCLHVKMLDATTYWSQYKSFSDKLKSQKPSTWINMSEKDIVESLRVIYSGNIAMKRREVIADVAASVSADEKDVSADEPTDSEESDRGYGRARTRAPTPARKRAPTPARKRSESVPTDCPKDVCWSFWQNGKCNVSAGKICRFKHVRSKPSAPSFSSSTQNNASGANPDGSRKVADGGRHARKGSLSSSDSDSGSDSEDSLCTDCGGDHHVSDCRFRGTCSYCGNKGHKVSFCRIKQRETDQKGGL